MQKIGIICEYNPFHNGHLYHINKIKEKYPDSLIILVLNGYFLERGNISIMDKFSKTKIALENNVDLVLELPFIYGTQSADVFAKYSIKILNEMQVNKIIFGSEINDVNKLIEIAKKQINNELDIKKYLNDGYNYPTALAKAINIDFEYKPNDLLGISYVKEIISNNYNIEIETIKRTNDYFDLESNDNIISGDNIRKKILNNENISRYVPNNVINNVNNIDYNLLFTLLKYKINTDNNLNCYQDMDEGLEYKIKKEINNVNSYEELILKVKSKRYTYNRLNRLFIHLLIGLTKEDNLNSKLDYIRILGFNNKGQNCLKEIKNNLSISTTIDNKSIIYKYELKASLIYDLLTKENTYKEELKKQPIKI